MEKKTSMIRILDVGSGDEPYPEANIFLDRYFGDTLHRSLRPLKRMPNMVKGDAHHLPFKDYSIDFLYSHHVIEHLDNPIAFLKEVDRVARHCKILAPNAIDEMHGWLFFNKYGLSRSHKNSYLPLTGKWIAIEKIHALKPNYSFKKKLWIKIVRFLPIRLRHLVLTAYLDILDEYCKNVGCSLKEFQYIR